MRQLNILVIICGFILTSISMKAQCDEFRHSTNWHDAWTSCEMAISPNPDRANSHWIMYDLKTLHELDRTYLWNYNDVNNLDFGIQEFAIDYSSDGLNWNNAGIFTMSQADGSPTYAGEAGPNFGGIQAQYVLITGLTNFGGSCMALSEVRIEASEVNVAVGETNNEHTCLKVDIFPNPVKDETRVYIESDCEGEVTYQLYDLLGKSISQSDVSESIIQAGYFELPVRDLNAGEYILEVQNKEGSVKKTLVKVNG